jgi:hypothetical protein
MNSARPIIQPPLSPARAVEVSVDVEGRGAAYALLARAAGELGDRDLFDHAILGYRGLLDRADTHGILVNPFTFREIRLRGLVATGRPRTAARLLRTQHVDVLPVAPQWRIIESVTAGHVLIASGQPDIAACVLRTTLPAAESHRLPHQVQRIFRAAREGGLTEVKDAAGAALDRLRPGLKT